MAEKAYKFRLYPNKQQEKLIRKTCGCARFVYNTTLAARQDAYKAGTSLSGNDCVKMLPGLKVKYPWLKEGAVPARVRPLVSQNSRQNTTAGTASLQR